MQFGEIFSKNRKTEPKSIYICRVFAMFLILMLLLVYAVILMYDIINGTPTIRTELKSVDSIPLPVVVIWSVYDFTMECWMIFNGMSMKLNYSVLLSSILGQEASLLKVPLFVVLSKLTRCILNIIRTCV